MQAVAQEMNLSETAFLLAAEDGFALRWFTPKKEVRLCGHATLASAHVLYESGRLARDRQARFHTLSGLLTARPKAEGWIELDFPAREVTAAEPCAGLLAALGVAASRFVGRTGTGTYLIELADEASVRDLRPDLAALEKLEARAVMVTSPGREECDFVSRFFAPAIGIPEDPVTGSAHCALGPYWQQRSGKTRLLARQVSDRGGVLQVEVKGDRVLLSGQAVTVMKGELSA
jgi:PhzF family phenazine biosynthesis protein